MIIADSEKGNPIYYFGASENFPKEIEGCIEREIEDGHFVRIGQKIDLDRWEASAEFSKRLFLIDEAFSADSKDTVERLRENFPEANLCMLINDDHSFPPIIRDYFQEGLIRSILPMNLRIDLWLGAIRHMLNGGHYLPADALKYCEQDRPPSAAALLTQRQQYRRAKGRFGMLTKRETEVLCLISEGYQNKSIAEKLSLSEHTIKLHIHHVISKLGVSNRTEAAAKYLQTKEQKTGHDM